jgi:GNAT superfamily N-acetyltransferase
MAVASFSIRPIDDDERDEFGRVVTATWGSPIVLSRGGAHDVRELPALVAVEAVTGAWLGTAAYRMEGDECELVEIEAHERHRGVGTALLEAVAVAARAAGANRMWLITTNDNLDAMRFYQRRGFHLVRLWPDAVMESRRRKPEIPTIGDYGIPIRDEVELEIDLRAPAEADRRGHASEER